VLLFILESYFEVDIVGSWLKFFLFESLLICLSNVDISFLSFLFQDAGLLVTLQDFDLNFTIIEGIIFENYSLSQLVNREEINTSLSNLHFKCYLFIMRASY